MTNFPSHTSHLIPHTSITRLTLHNFRNTADRRYDIPAKPVLLIGPNGAGKTNILEALSLFAPGRGLRSASLRDMQNFHEAGPFAIAIAMVRDGMAHDLSTGLDPASEKERRLVRVNGETLRRQDELTDYIGFLWLTPQMDKIWLEDKSQRRKFLDRLVASFDPSHHGRITRYEQAMRERMKLLQWPRSDEKWIGSLEKLMAETGVAIAAQRLDMIQRLNDQKQNLTSFPSALLALDGIVETWLAQHNALYAEDLFFSQLTAERAQDKSAEQTHTGPHRSDFLVFDKSRNLPAALCSTGEQKALLVSLTLSHAALIKMECGTPPILLLDEIMTHLDDKRRASLIDNLQNLQTQFWISATNAESVPGNVCEIITL